MTAQRQMSAVPGRWVCLQPCHLAEGARDANGLGAEVDRHCGSFYLYDATQPVRIVGDEVVQRVLLDRWLGARLEWATGQMPAYWSCHPLQYLLGLGTEGTCWEYRCGDVTRASRWYASEARRQAVTERQREFVRSPRGMTAHRRISASGSGGVTHMHRDGGRSIVGSYALPPVSSDLAK